MEKTNTNFNRRAFLKASALVGGGLMIQFSALAKLGLAERGVDAGAAAEWSELTGYIKITADNTIKIICPNPEFGQNVMTSLPMIVAEELDVNWKKVVVEMGPHDNTKLGPSLPVAVIP
jgi:isoquinoline 1-oxidoreductase beta subunit